MILESNRSRILKLQKQCIRIIENEDYSSHIDPLFKKLKLLKWDDIIELDLCEFAFQVKENIITKHILVLFQIICLTL